MFIAVNEGFNFSFPIYLKIFFQLPIFFLLLHPASEEGFCRKDGVRVIEEMKKG